MWKIVNNLPAQAVDIINTSQIVDVVHIVQSI